jgi:hypothetical protein
MKKNKIKKQGSALIMSLLSLSILAIVTLNIGGVVKSEYLSNSASTSADSLQAAYHSFSGVQYAIDQILTDLADGEAEANSSVVVIVDDNVDNDFNVSWPAFSLTDTDTSSGTITANGFEGDVSVTVTAGITITKEITTIPGQTADFTAVYYTVKITSWDEEVS